MTGRWHKGNCFDPGQEAVAVLVNVHGFCPAALFTELRAIAAWQFGQIDLKGRDHQQSQRNQRGGAVSAVVQISGGIHQHIISYAEDNQKKEKRFWSIFLLQACFLRRIFKVKTNTF